MSWNSKMLREYYEDEDYRYTFVRKKTGRKIRVAFQDLWTNGASAPHRFDLVTKVDLDPGEILVYGINSFKVVECDCIIGSHKSYWADLANTPKEAI